MIESHTRHDRTFILFDGLSLDFSRLVAVEYTPKTEMQSSRLIVRADCPYGRTYDSQGKDADRLHAEWLEWLEAK